MSEKVVRSNVDHPAHYNHPGKRECIDVMLEEFGALAVYWFCKLSAFKYEYRKGTKDGNSLEQDEAKAAWYEGYAGALKDGCLIAMKDVLKALAPWDETVSAVKEQITGGQDAGSSEQN